MVRIGNYINGILSDASSACLDNYNPAEGKIYSQLPDSGRSEVEAAVKAASLAFPVWSTMPVEKRSAILLRIADLVDRDVDSLALAECVDTGKPLTLAKRLDIPRDRKRR